LVIAGNPKKDIALETTGRAFWWTWSPWSNVGGCCDAGFTPQNKPAKSVLTCSYVRYIVYLPIVLRGYAPQ